MEVVDPCGPGRPARRLRHAGSLHDSTSDRNSQADTDAGACTHTCAYADTGDTIRAGCAC